MKKGCFLSTIIFLTIAIGIGFYLFKRYGPDIKQYGKNKLVDLAVKQVNERINYLKNPEYKDSLRIYFDKQFELIRNSKQEDSYEKFGNLVGQFKIFCQDSLIDSVEYLALKNIAVIDERSKKN